MSHQPSAIEQRIAWTHFKRQTDKDVMKAMARWFCWRADGTAVRFTIAQLVLRSGIPQRSVERALERLEADWWIEITARRRGSRQPTTYRLVLERLATTDPDALTVAGDAGDQPPEWRSNGPHNRHSGGCPPEWRMKNAPDFEKVADLSTEEAVRTDLCTPPPDRTSVRHSGGRPEHPDVPVFLAWASATYPQHAAGARLVLDRDGDGHLVHGLLESYPLERLQAMTVLCWTIDATSDPMSHASWIARSDRSLRVVRHKAAFLERVVVGAQQLTLGPLEERPLSAREIREATDIRTRVYGGCPHDPRHGKFTDCVRAIAQARKVG